MSAPPPRHPRGGSDSSADRGLWLQAGCTGLVALGAAFASYRHGQAFALRYGSDGTTAAVWPLIVDGLLTTATVELWRPGGGKWRAWLAFLFGIGLSLCANIASAPELSAFAVAVAACPPLALLLAVELLNRAIKRHRAKTSETETNETGETNETETSETGETGAGRAETPGRRTETGAGASETRTETRTETGSEIGSETARVVSLAVVSPGLARRPMTAQQRMWDYYQVQRAQGRTPTGAELDRLARTNNYGRRVLRRWRDDGRAA